MPTVSHLDTGTQMQQRPKLSKHSGPCKHGNLKYALLHKQNTELHTT